MFRFVRRHWACMLLLFVMAADVVLVDPLPFVDEVVLAGLTMECFRRHRSPKEAQ